MHGLHQKHKPCIPAAVKPSGMIVTSISIVSHMSQIQERTKPLYYAKTTLWDLPLNSKFRPFMPCKDLTDELILRFMLVFLLLLSFCNHFCALLYAFECWSEACCKSKCCILSHVSCLYV